MLLVLVSEHRVLVMIQKTEYTAVYLVGPGQKFGLVSVRYHFLQMIPIVYPWT